MRCAAILFLCMVASAAAQTPGTCEPSSAEAELAVEGGNVSAFVYNGGTLFRGNGATSPRGYTVPKANSFYPVYIASLWVGGKVDDEIRVAGSLYSRLEFWPGPLEQDAVLPNSADCSPYDRIFVVSRADVSRYLETGQLTDDLRDWPAGWGAPVLDGDGIESNYNLAGGDQPAVYGDQTAWWVMNDVGNAHERTDSEPLGVEVQASAFVVATEFPALSHATFYRYVVVNRSSAVIDSAYVSMFVDTEVGSSWVGSDTTLSMGFAYDYDRPAGGVPVAQGYQIVRGPELLENGMDDDRDGEIDEPGERGQMTRMTYMCGSCTIAASNDPIDAPDFYNQMRGRWNDGTPITASGFGYQTNGPVTLFALAGDPVEGECWSERNDCEGGMLSPLRGWLVVHTGPFRLAPGESEEVVFAMPFAQGSDNLDAVRQLRLAAHATQAAWDAGYLDPNRVETGPLITGFQLQVSSPYPNPFTDQTTIRYELSEPMHARLVVFDVLGREVAILADGEQSAGSYEVHFDAADLAPGIYIVRFEAAGEEHTFSIVKLRR